MLTRIKLAVNLNCHNWVHLMNKFRYVFLATVLIVFTVAACDAPDDVDPANTANNANDTWEPLELSSEYARLLVDRVVADLEHPWSIAIMPDESLLVTERPGRLLHVRDGEATEISGVPEVEAHNQGGLLEVALHPEFEENSYVYLTYSKPNADDETATTLARGVLDNGALTDVEDIFVQNQYSSPGRHYGSRLAWLSDGTLLMSIGDRGADPPRAQDASDHAGTLLRLTDDGGVPDDNPFLDDADVADEIYSYGHRNIQGLVVDPSDDTIWATDHGPRGGDLLVRVEAGANYGWPVVTQGLDYRTQEQFPDAEARSMEGIDDPFYEFLPTLAPSGLALVTHDAFERWQGDLLAGGLRAERIRRVVTSDTQVLHEEELLLQEIGRIRDIREAPDGSFLIATDHSDGAVYRVSLAD